MNNFTVLEEVEGICMEYDLCFGIKNCILSYAAGLDEWSDAIIEETVEDSELKSNLRLESEFIIANLEEIQEGLNNYYLLNKDYLIKKHNDKLATQKLF